MAMGIFGGFLGLTAGAGGGLVRNTRPAVMQGGLCGLALGAMAGVAACWVLVPLFYQFMARAPNPMFPVVLHSSFYIAIGAAAGLAFGCGLLGRSGAARGFLAGAMGAVLGSVLFAVVHPLAFPLEWDFSPMPGVTLSRLLAHLCVAILTLACAVIALRDEFRDVGSQAAPPVQHGRSGPAAKAR